MTHAMVFDAVRTPRGKGKRDGSLHAVKPVDLLGGLLNQLQARHDFDTAEVDDVVGDGDCLGLVFHHEDGVSLVS